MFKRYGLNVNSFLKSVLFTSGYCWAFKTMQEKEKMLITRFFVFSCSIFRSFRPVVLLLKFKIILNRFNFIVAVYVTELADDIAQRQTSYSGYSRPPLPPSSLGLGPSSRPGSGTSVKSHSAHVTPVKEVVSVLLCIVYSQWS